MFTALLVIGYYGAVGNREGGIKNRGRRRRKKTEKGEARELLVE
jgi:hypothetical protein